MIHYEGVYDNIAAWVDDKEKLDVSAMYDLLQEMFGPDTPTNYCAKLLHELDRLGIFLEREKK